MAAEVGFSSNTTVAYSAKLVNYGCISFLRNFGSRRIDAGASFVACELSGTADNRGDGSFDNVCEFEHK